MQTGRAVPARTLLCGVMAVVLAGNLSFILNLYGFLTVNGGAPAYGTILSYKRQAVACLAGNEDVLQLQSEKRLVEMNKFSRVIPPSADFPVLATLIKITPTGPPIPPDTAVLIVDRYRVNFTDEQWAQLAPLPRREFGPIQLYFLPSAG